MGPTRPIHNAWVGSTLLLTAVFVLLLFSAIASPRAHAAVGKGIVDHRLEYHGGIGLASVPDLAAEMGPTALGARWTRVFVYWDQLQPDAPWLVGGNVWDETYLHELETVVSALRAQGMQVILTGSDPPAWARDTKYKKYWSHNPTTAVVRAGDARVLRAFQDFAAFVAGHFAPAPYEVRHFEVWNEPNLRLLPQVVGGKIIGPEVYRKMLVAFSRGAHAANRSAVVIAGATSRMGSNGTSAGSTSPQWFARYLKRKGATRWFNAYSHHPYSTRMSNPSPSAKPRRPDISVTLGNLPVLLKLFPRTPFYLTEYCYSTDKRDAFVISVSQTLQARYMRQAYALCGTRAYRQVKVLLWFLVRDWQADPSDPDSIGVYTGVIDENDRRKPSWWAFAGGNRLSISAPTAVASAAPFTVDGALTTKEGPGAGVKVLLQRRGLTTTTWSTVGAGVKTDEAGTFSFPVTQTAGKRYRVVWDGVCESSQVTVRLGE